MSTYSINTYIAIVPLKFEKIETEVKNGFAFNANRIRLTSVEVVMNYDSPSLKLAPGDKILLKGDAALAPWAKQILSYGELEFVLCPESVVIGVELAEVVEEVEATE